MSDIERGEAAPAGGSDRHGGSPLEPDGASPTEDTVETVEQAEPASGMIGEGEPTSARSAGIEDVADDSGDAMLSEGDPGR
jgi:hypothetical protein